GPQPGPSPAAALCCSTFRFEASAEPSRAGAAASIHQRVTPPTGAHQREQLFGDLRSLLLRDRLQNRLERGRRNSVSAPAVRSAGSSASPAYCPSWREP